MSRMDECTNFAEPGKCHEWIMDRFKGKDMDNQDRANDIDLQRADAICTECPNFEKKAGKEVFSATQKLMLKGRIVEF